MFKNHITSNVFIYDLFKPDQIKAGTLKASQLVKSYHEVNIIICGGDGTIQWVLSLIYEAGITFDQVNFGILPIGTGNDFSRSTGWGY